DDHLVGNYQYGNSFTQPVTATSTIQTLPDSVYAQDQRSQSVNRSKGHQFYGTYAWLVNKYSPFRFNINYNNSTSDNQFSDTALSAFNGIPVNRTSRTIQSA